MNFLLQMKLQERESLIQELMGQLQLKEQIDHGMALIRSREDILQKHLHIKMTKGKILEGLKAVEEEVSKLNG